VKARWACKGRAVSHLEHSRSSSNKILEFFYFQAVNLLALETKMPWPVVVRVYAPSERAVASKPIQRCVSEFNPLFITTRLFTGMIWSSVPGRVNVPQRVL
jgi:hypothetical protein